MGRKKKEIIDVMMTEARDRRLMNHVPDPTRQRSGSDRRDNKENDRSKPQFARYAGQRYVVDLDVFFSVGKGKPVKAHCGNLSQTGMMLDLPEDYDINTLEKDERLKLNFKLRPGVLQEGAEKHYRIGSKVVRILPATHQVAIQFDKALYQERAKVEDQVLFTVAVTFLFICTLVIMLMRVESINNFAEQALLYGYSILAAAFLLSRYLFGMLYRVVDVDPDYTPGVTIIIPCFNEETWIRRTILSCVDQDYPVDKLEFIIVDDGSSDNSVQVITDTINDLCREGKRFHMEDRIRFFQQRYNQGKREAMGLGIRNARTELIAFVDSDSFLEPDAIRNLVQPLKDPKTGGVAGRTDVANTYTNHLTKMQSVRYYISFRIMKAAEATFDSVMCLSGPLSCYRLSYVQEVFEPWLHQKFLGQKATFGDDRSLTNFIVKKYRTYYQDTAICSTIVPNRHKQFLKQQMRWKRSWLRESLKAGAFIWKKEPMMSFFFYLGLLVPLIAPLIVLYNLVYIPVTHHVFPTTFLLGLLLMALMMSFTQLILKKSRLWIYGIVFCLYYELLLLWQMPWAWFTFWVSNWGTRGKGKTRQTILEEQREKEQQNPVVAEQPQTA